MASHEAGHGDATDVWESRSLLLIFIGPSTKLYGQFYSSIIVVDTVKTLRFVLQFCKLGKCSARFFILQF